MDMDTGKYIPHVLLKECTTPFPRRCIHLLECVLYGSVTTAACVLHEQRVKKINTGLHNIFQPL